MRAFMRPVAVGLIVVLCGMTALPATAGAGDDLGDLLGELEPVEIPPDRSEIEPVPVDWAALEAARAEMFAGMDTTQSSPPDAVGSAAVTTYVVTTQLDIVDGGDSLLSLREAVSLANSDGTDSIIQLTPGVEYVLALCAGTEDDTNATGDLDYLGGNRLTIIGGPRIEVDALFLGLAVVTNNCPGERILHSFSSAELTLRGINMQDGDSLGGGGAALSLGPISVEDSLFTGNRAAQSGGALGSFSDVTATRTFFLDNEATDSAGAIVGGNVDLTNVSIGASTAAVGAAVLAFGDLDTRFAGLGLNNTTTLGSADVVVGGNLFSFASFHVLPQGPSLLCAVSGSTTSGGYNFANDLSCGLTTATDTQSLTTNPQTTPFLPDPRAWQPVAQCDPRGTVLGRPRHQIDQSASGCRLRDRTVGAHPTDGAGAHRFHRCTDADRVRSHRGRPRRHRPLAPDPAVGNPAIEGRRLVGRQRTHLHAQRRR